MSHGLMSGMFWAGVLLSIIPILASIGIALFIWHESRHGRSNRCPVPLAEEVQP